MNSNNLFQFFGGWTEYNFFFLVNFSTQDSICLSLSLSSLLPPAHFLHVIPASLPILRNTFKYKNICPPPKQDTPLSLQNMTLSPLSNMTISFISTPLLLLPLHFSQQWHFLPFTWEIFQPYLPSPLVLIMTGKYLPSPVLPNNTISPLSGSPKHNIISHLQCSQIQHNHPSPALPNITVSLLFPSLKYDNISATTSLKYNNILSFTSPYTLWSGQFAQICKQCTFLKHTFQDLYSLTKNSWLQGSFSFNFWHPL